MGNDEDDHSKVKQAVDEEYSEDTAEQPSIKINVPQALEADIQVEEEEDLETVLANLELLARRQSFDTDVLSRSVEEQGEQEVLPEADKDLLGWLQQLDENLGTVEDHLQDLDKRVDRVEDELGGGEDSQLAELMDRIRELEESVEELPKDVSRHLGEIRDQVRELEEYVDDVEAEVEDLNQQFTESEGETSEEEASEKEAQQEDEASPELEEIVLPVSEEKFRLLSQEDRITLVRRVIERKEPVKHSTLGWKFFDSKAERGTEAFSLIQNTVEQFRDELENISDGELPEYRLKDEPGIEAPQEDDVDESEDKEEEEEDEADEDEAAEGLFRSVSAFKNLSTEQRADEVKQVIRENQPIGTSGICKKLFGHEAKSGTEAYTAVQNIMQDFRDELEKEKDGRKRKYRFPESEDHDSSGSSEAESETTTEVEEDEGSGTQVSEQPEAPQPKPTEAGQVPEPEEDSTDSDRPDLSDNGGRYSLEELRKDEDLSVEAEVLKVFQEYRKSHGPISIPEATKILFGFRASEKDEEYQVVWNQLEKHREKEMGSVEEIEKEEETLYKIYGPFKLSNLFYDNHHKIICTECPPGANALFSNADRSRQGAKSHKNNKDHNAFVSGQIPSVYQNYKTISTVVDRECGNE